VRASIGIGRPGLALAWPENIRQIVSAAQRAPPIERYSGMVFPLYDENPLEKPSLPIVTFGLIGLNIIVWLAQINFGVDSAIALYGFKPATLFANPDNPWSTFPALTLFSSMFMHQSWMHIAGNMLYLWVFGDDIEEALGRLRFTIFYLLSGVAADLFYSAFNVHSKVTMVGASGAISGVLAAYLLLRPCARVSVLFGYVLVRVRAFWVIGFFIAVQIWSLATASNDGVAYLDHVGGMIAGGALFAAMRPKHVKLLECIQKEGEQADVPAYM
jgi:membrane associated rhomboid family serine protease